MKRTAVVGMSVGLCALLGGAGGSEAVAQPRPQGASEAAAMTRYTVRPGDTCASIARRLYRDARRIDVIHANNALGPAPHHLRAGTVLTLPRRAPPLRGPAPDATLSALGGSVDVLSPSRRAARPNDLLFRGNQVATHDRSSAEITFLDESQIHLQDNTLVVILGDTSGRVRRTATARDTTLVSGGLRAFLGTLAGRPTAAMPIQTPVGRVMVGAGEAAVAVDARRRTTLAVYHGTSRLRTRRQTVTVPQGFSIAAAPGATTPIRVRALPAVPVWTTRPSGLRFVDGPTDVSMRWRGGGSETPAGWRVQVARDPSFIDLVADERTPPAVTELAVRGVPVGAIHVRVMALDADGVESPSSEEAVLRTATPRVVPTATARQSVIELPNGIHCGLDDGPRRVVTAALPVERTHAHTLRCGLDDTSDGGAVFAVAAEGMGPLRVTATLVAGDGGARRGSVRVRVIDREAEPVTRPTLAVQASAGASAEAGVAQGEPGVFLVPVRWDEGTRRVSLRVAIDGESADAAPLELPLPPAPPPPAARFVDRLSLTLDVGGGSMLSLYQQNRDTSAYGGNARGFGLALQGGGALSLALSDALAVQISARQWAFPSDLVPTGLALVDAAGLRLSPRLSSRARLVLSGEAGVAFTGDLTRFSFGFAVGLDLRVTGALSLAPTLRFAQVVQPDGSSGDDSLDEDARFWSLGLGVTLRLPR